MTFFFSMENVIIKAWLTSEAIPWKILVPVMDIVNTCSVLQLWKMACYAVTTSVMITVSPQSRNFGAY
jgi:hypothetical protein